MLVTNSKCDAEGKGIFSIRAVARLADINFGGLAKSLKSGVELEPPQLAETLISRGFEGVDLEQFAKTGIPDIAAAVVIEYYAFDAGRHCTEHAKA